VSLIETQIAFGPERDPITIKLLPGGIVGMRIGDGEQKTVGLDAAYDTAISVLCQDPRNEVKGDLARRLAASLVAVLSIFKRVNGSYETPAANSGAPVEGGEQAGADPVAAPATNSGESQ
jgi:hypothetical protein